MASWGCEIICKILNVCMHVIQQLFSKMEMASAEDKYPPTQVKSYFTVYYNSEII